MTDKKSPCRKAGAYGAGLAADEDLSQCVWHFLLPPVGMPPVLVLMSSLLQVCVCRGETGLLAPIWGSPTPALLLMGFAKFILKPVSNFEMQLFQVAAVASPESHPKQSLRLWQVLEQVGLSAPVFSSDQHLLTAIQFQFWLGRGLKKQ